jgi:murein DD-endopeptidase MepM/ murein hydrolase activator NlpD
MRRETLIIIILAALCALMATAIILRSVDLRRARQQVKALEQELAEDRSQETATGGAETRLPQAPALQGEEQLLRFPLAEGDFRTYTSPFGYRVSPILGIEVLHEGLDIAGAWRSQVVAVADGVVVEHWPPPDNYWRGHETYGGMIRIQHDNGMETLYAHLSWTRIHTGDRVRAGQVIGRIGNTGKSDGEHLHFEVISPEGERLNPLLYMEDPR